MEKITLDSTIDYKAVFYSAPSLFLLLKPDLNFTIIDASDAYLSATLTKRHEIINRGLFDVFPDNPNDLKADGVSNLRSSLQRVVDTKQQHIMAMQKYDIPLSPEMGSGFEERFWNPKNSPVLNSENEIIYIIHNVEDVTAKIYLQRENEKQLLLINENEDRINAILNSLLQYTTMDFSERLTVSDKGDELDAIICGLNSLIDELESQMMLLTEINTELEYANKELDSFSYSVSHDLRAPLRAISGFSQVLTEDYGNKLDEAGKQTIQTIIRNAQKMGALIDDLLTFSRVGKQNITKVILDMNRLVDTIIQEFTNQQSQNKIEFIVNPLEIIEADSSMLKQVLTNLISNAIKYSSKKEISVIEIGSYKNDNSIVYYVKDNGTGFDMKYYDKLFGVFQRLHSASEFEGTGVGLALVQRIIKKHLGEVWAEASVDEGATFYFLLPVN